MKRVLLGVGVLAGWAIFGFVFSRQIQHGSQLLLPDFVESEESVAVSPDGEYTARLIYRENSALTYGFFVVTLESRGSGWPSHGADDVVEVASEGLVGLKWSSARTLKIDYIPKGKGRPEEVAEFVRQPSAWRDVELRYRAVNGMSH